MSYYDTLTESEKKVYDHAGKSCLDNLSIVVKTVHQNNPSCDTIKIKDFHTIVAKLREMYEVD